MSISSRKLYYRRADTTYSCNLYTTTSDLQSNNGIITEHDDVAGCNLYLALIGTNDLNTSYLKAQKNGIIYSLAATSTSGSSGGGCTGSSGPTWHLAVDGTASQTSITSISGGSSAYVTSGGQTAISGSATCTNSGGSCWCCNGSTVVMYYYYSAGYIYSQQYKAVYS